MTKGKFSKHELEYMVSHDGVKPSPNKVKAISNWNL